jgi:hypothetical protein
MWGAPTLARLIAHPDRLTETGNMIALVLAWNAPFYPLYVWMMAGSPAFPSALLTACALPVFAAVPALSRRSGLAARVALCLAGTANVVFCTWVLGYDSGIALFLLPCLMLATLLFHPAEWRASVPLVGLAILAGLLARTHLPAAPHLYSGTQYRQLLAMNGLSVAILTAFLGYAFARAIPDRARGLLS